MFTTKATISEAKNWYFCLSNIFWLLS